MALRAQADSVPRLGIGASGALSVHAGIGQFKHASLGPEIGAALDLGWLAARRVRVGVGLDYLATRLHRPDSLGQRVRGDAYVFTAFADVTVLTSLDRRIAPYAGAGFGVDAVGTTVQNEQVGALYNTNVFDLHAQLGAFVRVTPRSRASLEVRATGARVVRRYAIRLGYTWIYNSLAPR